MSSAPTEHVKRPGGVTLLVVLGLIEGIASLIGGLAIVLDQDDGGLQGTTGMSDSQLVSVGVVIMITGIIMIVLALALRNGSDLVRWLFGIFAIFHVASGLWGLIALYGEQQLFSAFSAVFGLIVLWILFGSERSDEFFAH